MGFEGSAPVQASMAFGHEIPELLIRRMRLFYVLFGQIAHLLREPEERLLLFPRGLKDHGPNWEAAVAGFRLRRVEHRAMPAMRAIEGADRERPTPLHAGVLHAIHGQRPSHLAHFLGVREGTISTASPSSTVLSSTLQTQEKVARLFSGINSVIFTVVITSAPMSTGALKLSVCEI